MQLFIVFLADIYLFKVNNRNTRKKETIETIETVQSVKYV